MTKDNSELISKVSEKYPDANISGMTEQDSLKTLLIHVFRAVRAVPDRRSKTLARLSEISKEVRKITDKIYDRKIKLCAECLSSAGLGPLMDESNKLYEKLQSDVFGPLCSDMSELRAAIKEPEYLWLKEFRAVTKENTKNATQS